MMIDPDRKDMLMTHVADIVAAYVNNNTLAAADLPALIQQVYHTLTHLDGGAGSLGTGALLGDRPQPAVPIKKSVMPDYIVCLEDGKKLKMLKRHLKTAYSMTPEQYRERWGLPMDYPMVAPAYAKKRSSLARDMGLGTAGRGKKGAR